MDTGRVNIATTTEPQLSTSSPEKALLRFSHQQFSGQLVINDHDGSTAWRVYTGNGSIHFAASTIDQQERTAYLLQRYHPSLKLLACPDQLSDYQYVCQYWQTGTLSLQEVRQILSLFTLEALAAILAIPQAALESQQGLGIDPILLCLSPQQAISSVSSQTQFWCYIRRSIPSLFHRPKIQDLSQFHQALFAQDENENSLMLVESEAAKQKTLYEVAHLAQLDAFHLTKMLQPLVAEDIVRLLPYSRKPGIPGAESSLDSYKIACVDDSPTVLWEINNLLSTVTDQEFTVFTIDDPIKALMQIVRIKPDLILLDVGMPELNGYELCRLLRNHSFFKSTPIIMVTANEGLINRAKARLAGASDYLNKPFTQAGLLAVVTHHLSQLVAKENRGR